MKHFSDILQKNKLLIIFYVLLGILLAFLNTFNASYFQKVIDDFGNTSISATTIIFYGLILVLLCVLSYLDEYPSRKLSEGLYLDFKIKALKKISIIEYTYYESLGTGNLVQKIESGSEAGKSILFDFFLQVLRDLVPCIIFSLIFIAKISIPIMFSIIVGYIIVFAITNLLLKYLYHIKENILTNEEMLNRLMIRGFMELVVFRINKRFQCEINKAASTGKEIVNSKVKMKLIHEAFFAIFALLITIIKVIILYYGWKTKALSVGSVVALISLVDKAYTPIAIFNVLYVQYKLDKAAFKRYTDFLDMPNDKQLQCGKYIETVEGNISFQKVSFSYEGKAVFEDLSFDLLAGQSIALVGESGSGKSTIVKLLIGLLKPKTGTIFVDKQDLSKFNLNSFYPQLSYISQESPVFDGTLRENLIFDSEVSENNILEVLKQVKLFDFFSSLNKGLDTRVGEKGVTLSGGERQRLALARLYFSNSKLIILDEATSAMDNITEKLVMNNLMKFLKGKTIIIIAHRLNTIENVDKLLVFKKGRILEMGSFHELLSNDSYFKQLYESNERTNYLL